MLDNHPNLVCPCSRRSPLSSDDNQRIFCISNACAYSENAGGFLRTLGKPVLINFEECDTVCNKDKYRSGNREFYVPRTMGLLAKVARRMLHGKNRVAERSAFKIIREITRSKAQPRVLIIGGAEIGQGVEIILGCKNISVTSIDIYPVEDICFVADAHYLPFQDESFDAVWVQAVLEHVVDPIKVVDEIYRVLNRDGMVYSEMPFMQSVHEGAYDFLRATSAGHRYLFKSFSRLDGGVLRGVGTSYAWALKGLILGITRSKVAANIFSLPMFVLSRFVDRVCSKKVNYEAANNSFFLGQKAERQCNHRTLIDLASSELAND